MFMHIKMNPLLPQKKTHTYKNGTTKPGFWEKIDICGNVL